MVRNIPGEIKHHGQSLNREQVAALMAESYGWIAADGDELRGTVLGSKFGVTDINGEPRNYPIVVVLMDEGKEIVDREDAKLKHDVIAVHCFHSSLVGEMKVHRPEPGDRIFVKRIGERGEAKRRGWNAPVVWAVAVTKPDGKAASIWDTFSEQVSSPSPAMAAPSRATAAQSQFDDEPPF
jgi:hypothetical protein